MNKKPVKLWAVILCGVTALIWTACSVLDFVYDTPSLFLRIAHILCALIWYIVLFVWMRRYRGARDQAN